MNTQTYTSKALLPFAISLLAVFSNTASASSQGTLTAVFENICTGDRQVGINAKMSIAGGGDSRTLSISHPGQRYSRDSIWLNCGDRVVKTLKYDFSRKGEDLQFKKISSYVSYIDNWRNNKSFTTKVEYDWPADGTICKVSYLGYMPPVADISCTQQ